MAISPGFGVLFGAAMQMLLPALLMLMEPRSSHAPDTVPAAGE